MSWHNKRTMLVEKIKTEVDMDRLAELLANDYVMQEAADKLAATIDTATERG